MERYNRITNKNQREIVLLQGRPCAWGKCRFCDYIDDNSRDREAMLALNRRVLSRVTGEFGVLEVINSGSCFELPRETLEEIRRILRDKNIRHLYFEAHWMYRKHLQEMREYHGHPHHLQDRRGDLRPGLPGKLPEQARGLSQRRGSPPVV